MGETESKPERYVHPLVRKEIGSVSDWPHWLGRWNQVSDVEGLLGLLHAGFSVKASYPDRAARICFYLEIADGHRDKSVFKTENMADQWNRDLPERRALLAKKARKMLCGYFFRDPDRDDARPTSWKALTHNPVLFEKLIWFFDPARSFVSNIPWRDDGHEGEIIRRFLEQWIVFCWGWRCENWGHDEKCEAPGRMFLAARPKFIEILHQINHLDFLLNGSMVADVDQASMEHLKKLALEPRYSRKYATAEEAAFGGCQFARVYLLLSILQKEGKRQREVAEAERVRREAEKKLESLTRSGDGR